MREENASLLKSQEFQKEMKEPEVSLSKLEFKGLLKECMYLSAATC